MLQYSRCNHLPGPGIHRQVDTATAHVCRTLGVSCSHRVGSSSSFFHVIFILCLFGIFLILPIWLNQLQGLEMKHRSGNLQNCGQQWSGTKLNSHGGVYKHRLNCVYEFEGIYMSIMMYSGVPNGLLTSTLACPCALFLWGKRIKAIFHVCTMNEISYTEDCWIFDAETRCNRP